MSRSKGLCPHELAPMWAKNLIPRKYQRGTKEMRVSVWWNRWWWWQLQFSFYWCWQTFRWLTLRRTESAEGCMYGSYPAGKPYAPHFPKRGRSKSSIIRQSVSPIHRLHPALPSPSPLSQKQPQSIPLTSRVRNTEIQNRFSADNITGKWWKIKLDKKESCSTGFSACGGSRKRHSTIPPQCDPRGAFLSYRNEVSYTIGIAAQSSNLRTERHFFDVKTNIF